MFGSSPTHTNNLRVTDHNTNEVHGLNIKEVTRSRKGDRSNDKVEAVGGKQAYSCHGCSKYAFFRNRTGLGILKCLIKSENFMFNKALEN